MITLLTLTKRNIKIYFKDKGMFFVSLITPFILLVLYSTFLGKVFKDAFLTYIPSGIVIEDSLIDGLVGGQLISSILATCTVTISFCSNMIMVQDKYLGSIKDFTISPVRKSILALSYFLASLCSTLLVCYITTALCFIYIGAVGWYLTAGDVFLILLDVFILALFGTSLSSLIHYFLKSQGQVSAVGTIVSSLYGFICGAYMPLSQYPKGLQNVLTFLPGTYGTSLLRNHAMGTAIDKLGLPSEALDSIRASVDCTIKFMGEYEVSILAMYLFLILFTLVVVGIYVLINMLRKNSRKSN